MRINRNIPVPLETADARRARGTTSPPKSASDGASIVSINANAGVEGGAVSADVKARLAEVREQLQNGTYEVDFDRLAENILETELVPKP